MITFDNIKKWLNISNVFCQVVTVVHIGLLLFENFPWYMVALGLATNVVYFLLLNDFPYISFTSPVFLLSVGV